MMNAKTKIFSGNLPIVELFVENSRSTFKLQSFDVNRRKTTVKDLWLSRFALVQNLESHKTHSIGTLRRLIPL